MKVTINSLLGADPEPEALVKAFERAVAFGGTGDDNIVEILCTERARSGWLEYGLSFKHPWGATKFYLAMVQRSPGAEFEFHS